MEIFKGVDEELIPTITENAKKVGLDKINYKEFYQLKKIGAKNKNPRGYPDEYFVIKGLPYVIGDKEYVWLYFNGIRAWFKTSPIVKVEEIEGGYRFETLNSVYEMT